MDKNIENIIFSTESENNQVSDYKLFIYNSSVSKSVRKIVSIYETIMFTDNLFH